MKSLGGETGETVVTSGGQCRQPHGLRDQIWSSRGQQLEEKKQTSKHKNRIQIEDADLYLFICFEYFGSSVKLFGVSQSESQSSGWR